MGSTKKTHEEYIIELIDKNPNVEPLEKYNGANNAILHKCKICGWEWTLRPSDALNGKGCKFCGYKRAANSKKRTHQKYLDDLFIVNPNIEPIEEYINVDTAILHRCKICSNKWAIKPNHTLAGHGCKLCAEKNNGNLKRKPFNKYIQELQNINPNIEVKDTYVNSQTKILHKCKQCGFEWLISPIHTLRGQGCPQCNQSHGERSVQIWLEQHNISFVAQKKFDDCRDKYVLPFDFYLPDYNICIEYQGQQHYDSVDYFGGEESFKYIQLHDKIKSDYCKSNNIYLISIPYWENIYEYLNKFLLI